MEKLRYKITLVVLIGTLAFLGPVLSNPKMSLPGISDIPRSYIYIFTVWALFILISGLIIQRSKW